MLNALPTKTDARRMVRAARRAMDEPSRRQHAEKLRDQVLRLLADYRPEARVAAYLSSGDEPNTAPLLEALHAAGRQPLVPVCGPNYSLSWTDWYPGVPLERSTLAPVDEPVGPRHQLEVFADVDLLIIPALGIDHAGFRLGQGGGYYDRFLPSLAGRTTRKHRTQVAALIYDAELLTVASFPVDAHDMPVDMAITPGGVQDFRP